MTKEEREELRRQAVACLADQSDSENHDIAAGDIRLLDALAATEADRDEARAEGRGGRGGAAVTTVPCIGSGYCCRRSPCPLAYATLGEVSAPCPALRHDGERHVCGIYVDAPEADRPRIARQLKLGRGCVAPEFREGGR